MPGYVARRVCVLLEPTSYIKFVQWSTSQTCLRPSAAHGRLTAAGVAHKDKLTAPEYDETTWSARTWMAFVTQWLSVASQLSIAQEAA